MGGAGSGCLAPAEAIRRAVNRVDPRLPEIFDALIDKALGHAPMVCPHCKAQLSSSVPDRESAIYLIDRRLGRPRQEVQIDAQVGIQLQPSDYHRLSLLQAAIQAVQVIDSPPRDNVIDVQGSETPLLTEPSSPLEPDNQPVNE